MELFHPHLKCTSSLFSCPRDDKHLWWGFFRLSSHNSASCLMSFLQYVSDCELPRGPPHPVTIQAPMAKAAKVTKQINQTTESPEDLSGIPFDTLLSAHAIPLPAFAATSPRKPKAGVHIIAQWPVDNIIACSKLQSVMQLRSVSKSNWILNSFSFLNWRKNISAGSSWSINA